MKSNNNLLINTDKIKELINRKYRGNISWFADDLNINSSYLSTLLNKNQKIRSDKLTVSIILYCKNNKLNYQDFLIFLN